MLEIVFDENKDATFLEQPCLLLKVEDSFLSSWQKMRGYACSLFDIYATERVLKIQMSQHNLMYFLALAFCVEAYAEATDVETVVFVVGDSQKALSEYKPFAALTNALRYMRDLLRMDEKEAYADIKRLGYLGLKIHEDYLKKQIVIQWREEKSSQYFGAMQKNAAFLLIALFKFWAICKDEQPRIGIIGENVWGDVILPNLSTEDEMIEYVIKNTMGEKCKLMID